MTDDERFEQKSDELQAVLDTVRDMLEAADLNFCVVVETQCGRYGAIDGSDDTPEEGFERIQRAYKQMLEAKAAGVIEDEVSRH